MDASNFYAVAVGIGTQNSTGNWLEVFYPMPRVRPDAALVTAMAEAVSYEGGNVAIELSDAQIARLAEASDNETEVAFLERLARAERPRVITFLETDAAITSTPEAYLKLHLLSHRCVRPNEQNLDNLFAALPNVCWTTLGAVDPAELTEKQLEARLNGMVMHVTGVDKFPTMANYVMPPGVRVADCSRVRLGAFLGEGTTVMPEGAVNFNAGSIGPNMIEGRLSQGVIMDSGSDLGGGASTMGTLSGGGEIVLSIGKDCLIGANGGTGIPLGDRCTIEAGLYITASTVVQVLDEHKNFVKVVKARELAGQSDMLFIRNSQSGVVECRTNKKAISLNEALHAHN